MKYKKIMALLAILFISCSLSACGGGQNDVFSESNTTMNEETETEKEEEKEESEGTKEETETTKESESQKETETESAEESKEQEKETETKESKTSQSVKESTPKQQEETKSVEPTPAPHTHNYSSSVIANPTCDSNGSKKYVCSCGDNYSEAIPATGHNWVTQYEEVYHESKGEMRQVQVGTSDGYVECATCHATFATSADFQEHCKATGDFNHAMSNCFVHSGEPIYENEWVITQEAFTEQIPYNVCSICGARQ